MGLFWKIGFLSACLHRYLKINPHFQSNNVKHTQKNTKFISDCYLHVRYDWSGALKLLRHLTVFEGSQFILKRCYILVNEVHVVIISPFTNSRYPWLSIAIVILKFNPTGVTSIHRKIIRGTVEGLKWVIWNRRRLDTLFIGSHVPKLAHTLTKDGF